MRCLLAKTVFRAPEREGKVRGENEREKDRQTEPTIRAKDVIINSVR